MRGYPEDIYKRITDDPATWDGLPTKGDAVRRVQEEYDRYFRPNWRIVGILLMLAAMVAVGGAVLMVDVLSKIPL